jgi:hypothetical protein
MVLVIFRRALYDELLSNGDAFYHLILDIDIVGYVPKSFADVVSFVSKMFSAVKDTDWISVERPYLTIMLRELTRDKKFLMQENGVALFLDKGRPHRHVYTIEKNRCEQCPNIQRYIILGRGYYTHFIYTIFVSFMPDVKDLQANYFDNAWIINNLEKATQLAKDATLHYGFAPFSLIKGTTLYAIKELFEKYVAVEFP